jgi:hypothetical protein
VTEAKWIELYRLVLAMAPMYGADEDQVMDVVTAAAEKADGDMVNDVIWGAIRPGFRKARREGWGQAEVIEDDDGEIVGLENQISFDEIFESVIAELNEDYSVEDIHRADVEATATGAIKDALDSNDSEHAQSIRDALTEYEDYEFEPETNDKGQIVSPTRGGLEIPRQDDLMDRIEEIYEDAARAKAASAVSAGYADTLLEDFQAIAEDSFGEEYERLPSYLSPEHTADEAVVENVASYLVEKGAFEWLVEYQDSPLYPQGLSRVRSLTLGLSPVEQVLLTRTAWFRTSSASLVDDLLAPLDEWDDEVQVQMTILGEIIMDAGQSFEQEEDPFADVSRRDIQMFVESIGPRVEPTDESWKMWDIAVARQAMAKAALTTRASWKVCAAAGRHAAKGSQELREANKARRNLVPMDFEVSKLHTNGVTSTKGQRITWSQVIKGNWRLQIPQRKAQFIAALKKLGQQQVVAQVG